MSEFVTAVKVKGVKKKIDFQSLGNFPSASVGQFLKVAAVDENNIPTAWETADAGGSSLKLHRIYIAVQPAKTAYKAGEVFDTAGMVVKADYAINGVVIAEAIEVTGYTYPTEGLGASVTAVTITYSEGGVVKTAEVAVSVTKTSVTIPTYSGSLVYNGKEQSAAFSNYNTTYMTASGDLKATGAGNYTAKFTLKNTDYYQWSDGTTAVKSVSWSIGKAAPVLTVNPASITLDPDHLTATATISTNSNGTLSVKSGDTGVVTASLSGKIITVSRVDKASGTAQVTISQAAASNYLAATAMLTVTVRVTTIYGAEWDGTSTSKLSRTDAAAEFTDPVPYVAGATTYGSPFDNLMPWAGMVKSERTGGTMVAIPKFWYKLTQTGNKIKVQIADGPVDGFHVSPAHMNRGDGKGERDVVYIGRYHCATSTYKSTTGVKPQASVTRANFRTNIHKLGDTIWQNDFATRFTLWLLYIVEFADWNSQKTIGKGCGNNSATQNMGYTDFMPYHTGTTLGSRDSYGLGTQYRNIEGLWDNVYDWCDGCYNNSSGLNIILNPNSFSDSSGGTAVGVPSSGYPSAFSVKTNGGFPLFIPSAASGSETTYSCDSWSFDASYPCVYVGGNYGQNGGRGLFYVYCNTASSTYASIGSRLLELP